MKPIVFIDPGHSDIDPGAVGFETEFRLNEAVSKYQHDYLKAHYDCQPFVCPSNIDSLGEICRMANQMGAALFVSNHFNAGKGDGFECYVYSEKRRSLGQIFEKHAKAAGQNSRGVKVKGYYVLANTNMPAVLTETAFVDNKTDIQDWNDDAELQKMGIAYAKAAAEFLGLKEIEPVPEPRDVSPVEMQTLSVGSEGKQVQVLQKLLGISDDGIFGKQTDAAVKKFQGENGLTPDGVVGQLTWNQLLGV